MPNYTDNLNLIKPKKSENYDIEEVTNKNMDIIDIEIGKKVNKVPGKGLSTNDFTDEFVKLIKQMAESKRGFTFFPIVDKDGNISWTNDGNLENPAPVNIKGEKGPEGPPNILTVGMVMSGEEASATITGDTPNQKLNLVLPKGDVGPQGPEGPKGRDGDVAHFSKIEIGNVTSGDEASACIRGEEPNQILDLVLPVGPPGQAGESDTIDVLFEGEATNGFLHINKNLKDYDEIDIYIRSADETRFIDRIEKIKINNNVFDESKYTNTIQFAYLLSGGYIDFMTLQINDIDICISSNTEVKNGIDFTNESDNPNKIVKVIGIIKNSLTESNSIANIEIDNLF